MRQSRLIPHWSTGGGRRKRWWLELDGAGLEGGGAKMREVGGAEMDGESSRTFIGGVGERWGGVASGNGWVNGYYAVEGGGQVKEGLRRGFDDRSELRP
jgi:hypothetical protein